MVYRIIKKLHSMLILVILLNTLTVSFAYGKEISFTQDDRDRLRSIELRLERLDTKLEELEKRMVEGQNSLQRQMVEGQNSLQRQMVEGQNSLQRQLDDLKTFMLWGFGILFGGMGILIGFVIWDRRTVLSPVIRSNRELEIKEEKIERALKEMAAKDHNVAEALRHAGLL